MCLQGLASVSFILKFLPAALSCAAPLGVAVEEALCKAMCLSLEAEPGKLEVSWMLLVLLSAPISRAVLGISDNHGQTPCLGKQGVLFAKLRVGCTWMKCKGGDFSVPTSHGCIVQVQISSSLSPVHAFPSQKDEN